MTTTTIKINGMKTTTTSSTNHYFCVFWRRLGVPFFFACFITISTIYSEIPRLLAIYDLTHLGADETKQRVRELIYARKDVKDPRVIQSLVNFGYYELEESMLGHKQKHHILMLLKGQVELPTRSKRLAPDASLEEHDQRWME